MLIDRDAEWVNDIAKVLEDMGYHVVPIESKNDAFPTCEDVKPDLGIFEASEDEWCCIDIAKELYERHDIPFIAISACEKPETINKAILSGALSYILKPIHRTQLVPVIESALQRASDIRRLQSAEENLATAIQSSRVISAAIGIMMERFRLTNSMAFEILRSEARSNQKKIIDMANEILTAAETVNQFNITKNTGKNKLDN